jgi:hypothetical protein
VPSLDQVSDGGHDVGILLPHNLAFGDFQLGDDRHLARAVHAWRAAARQLSGTKTRQDCELERVQFKGTVYHRVCLSQPHGWEGDEQRACHPSNIVRNER